MKQIGYCPTKINSQRTRIGSALLDVLIYLSLTSAVILISTMTIQKTLECQNRSFDHFRVLRSCQRLIDQFREDQQQSTARSIEGSELLFQLEEQTIRYSRQDHLIVRTHGKKREEFWVDAASATSWRIEADGAVTMILQSTHPGFGMRKHPWVITSYPEVMP